MAFCSWRAEGRGERVQHWEEEKIGAVRETDTREAQTIKGKKMGKLSSGKQDARRGWIKGRRQKKEKRGMVDEKPHLQSSESQDP